MKEDIAIRIDKLTVAYEAQPVLWNISLAFKKGKMTAIVGPNGAGKSSMIKAMLGLVKPVTGEVVYQDKDQQAVSYKELKNRIAYVPQNTSVDWDFPTTVRDVVLMGRYGHLGWFKRPKKADREIAKQMLGKVGLPTFASRQISQLSGGQRQRVFLARALAQEAEVYIMDEPLAGVDMKTERIIMKLLKELVSEGKTVLVVHHDLQTVEDYFDDIVFINQEVIAAGRVEDTFDKQTVKKTYHRDRNLGEGE
ncbi:manganese/zinc/iron transport system ATP-binding protein [Alkalibacterium subtropicum]|uniref:Manganese/zinc/iron transport system ATP-binding protein n=1 Tax=Alkalibacterium subtropicum TaxID=753702 RepID=A0A1I1FG70_9LACT|nr:metal ABC transporter ATP-binding protein [Alkalibacterium subtropicum]SFB98489.1 manganese/zinc/iron transport system ATP-binding protein [Alkalibacterium subtropicum]